MSCLKSVCLKYVCLKSVLSKICPSKKRRGPPEDTLSLLSFATMLNWSRKPRPSTLCLRLSSLQTMLIRLITFHIDIKIGRGKVSYEINRFITTLLHSHPKTDLKALLQALDYPLWLNIFSYFTNKKNT